MIESVLLYAQIVLVLNQLIDAVYVINPYDHTKSLN